MHTEFCGVENTDAPEDSASSAFFLTRPRFLSRKRS